MMDCARIIEAGYEMQRYIERCLPKCIPLIPYIVAQMCHETAFGTSKLCIEANNFCGMKDRGMGEATYQYTDWDGQTESYESAPRIADFPNLYFRFLGRDVYSGWYDHRDDGDCFIKHLEDCGWCGSTPGEKTYSEKILDLMDGEKFKQVMAAIPDWLGPYEL